MAPKPGRRERNCAPVSAYMSYGDPKWVCAIPGLVEVVNIGHEHRRQQFGWEAADGSKGVQSSLELDNGAGMSLDVSQDGSASRVLVDSNHQQIQAGGDKRHGQSWHAWIRFAAHLSCRPRSIDMLMLNLCVVDPSCERNQVED